MIEKLVQVSVAVFCTLAGSAAAAAEKPEKVARPNFVLCMTDDQGWGDVGYNADEKSRGEKSRGSGKVKTPNLDAMAAAGLRFNRFYAAAPCCSPTRGSCMTGRHPFRYDCRSPGLPLRPEEISIAQAIKPLGYATAHFGKWHLNGDKSNAVLDPSGNAKIIARDDPLSPGRFGFDEWLSSPNFFDLDGTLSRRGTPETFKGDGSEYIVGEALKYVRQVSQQGKPFLTVIWFGSPHGPWRALPQDRKAAGSDYYGEILALDRAMGRLRTELRQMGLTENTLLWFCSDNGATGPGSTGGLRGQKSTLWEGGVRVPGLIEWPARIKKPCVTDVPAVTSDIYPTILDILQHKVPNQVEPLDGISLLPLIDGQMQQRPKPIGFWHVNTQAWIDNRYKLHKLGPEKYELYDLVADPTESKDLSAEHPDTVARMKSELDAWQESVAKSRRRADYPPKLIK